MVSRPMTLKRTPSGKIWLADQLQGQFVRRASNAKEEVGAGWGAPSLLVRI